MNTNELFPFISACAFTSHLTESIISKDSVSLLVNETKHITKAVIRLLIFPAKVSSREHLSGLIFYF